MMTSEPLPDGGSRMWPTPKATDGEKGGRGDLLAVARTGKVSHSRDWPAEAADDPQLMLWPEDSPASPSPSPGKASRRRIAGGSGPQPVTSFATYDPATSSWKTFQGCLDGEWETYSATWPPAGMTRNGIAFRRASSVPPIYATASSSWPTPQAQDLRHSTANAQNRLQSGRQLHLAHVVALEDESLTAVSGQLNPEWVEWLMGYPAGWTDSED